MSLTLDDNLAWPERWADPVSSQCWLSTPSNYFHLLLSLVPRPPHSQIEIRWLPVLRWAEGQKGWLTRGLVWRGGGAGTGDESALAAIPPAPPLTTTHPPSLLTLFSVRCLLPLLSPTSHPNRPLRGPSPPIALPRPSRVPLSSLLLPLAVDDDNTSAELLTISPSHLNFFRPHRPALSCLANSAIPVTALIHFCLLLWCSGVVSLP